MPREQNGTGRTGEVMKLGELPRPYTTGDEQRWLGLAWAQHASARRVGLPDRKIATDLDSVFVNEIGVIAEGVVAEKYLRVPLDSLVFGRADQGWDCVSRTGARVQVKATASTCSHVRLIFRPGKFVAD